MKILRIQSRICIGGPALHTIALTSHLNHNQYRTTLISGALQADERNISSWASSKNVKYVTIKEMKRHIFLLNDIIALIKIFRLIKKEKPDIVHTHTAKAGAIGRLAAWLAHVPRIYHTFHGHTFEGYFHPLLARAIVLCERTLGKISNRIIVISNSQQDDICRRFKIAPRHKTEVIPLGIDFDRLANPKAGFLKAMTSGSNNATHIGAIGRLVAIKDHRLLLQAFAKVKGKLNSHSIKLFIIGEGELKTSLAAYAHSLGVGEDVIFTGTVENIQDAYADLDLVILTSKNEGTPVSLIEAMYFGIPILATDIGGVRDTVPPNCGVLVKSRRADDIADELAHLIADDNYRNSFKNHGRKLVLDRFGLKRLVADIDRLYQRDG